MLDPEARALLDLMEQAAQDGRPKLETLAYKEGRAAVDKMSEESEAEPLRGRIARMLASGKLATDDQ